MTVLRQINFEKFLDVLHFPDLEQKVVAPSDLVSSSKLKTVSYGYGVPAWLLEEK